MEDGHDPYVSSNLEQPRLKKRVQYVYYRLYSPDGPIQSHNPIYAGDLFISRTPAKFIPPPHSAGSLKRHLCSVEGFASPDNTQLFVPFSSLTAKDDSTRISLLASPGPGLSPQEPVALLLEGSLGRAGAIQQVGEQDLKRSDLSEMRYIHYRPYSLERALKSKMCFDEDDVFLGRLDTLSVPPPHTAGSLAARIAMVEGLVIQDTQSAGEVQVFKDIDSEVAMKTDVALSLTEDRYLGHDEDEPVAVVYKIQHLPKSSITALAPEYRDTSWLSVMPKDILHISDSNAKFYFLPIGTIVSLDTPFRTGGVMMFQSVGLNMDSCVSYGTDAIRLSILSASEGITLHMGIRRGLNCIVFNDRAGRMVWGSEQTVPLRGLFKGPNPTITFYDQGDRYQILIDNVMVKEWVKRIKEDVTAVLYWKHENQVTPFSSTLAMKAYTSLADVIT